MAVSLLLSLFASILVVSDGALSSAVKEHRQLVRTEKLGRMDLNLPEAAGSFDQCEAAAENENHIPLPNSADPRSCNQYTEDGHALGECSCRRLSVDGVALTTPKQEYTCCHKEYTTPGTNRWRCYTDCVHPLGNGQNVTLLEEEKKAVEVEEQATVKKQQTKKVVTSANLPEIAGSFQNCYPTSANRVANLANSAQGRACSDMDDPSKADENLVECACERIATLGEAIPVNETGHYETEFTCCQKNLTEGVNRGKCATGCVRS
jgi:hypothetical protein